MTHLFAIVTLLRMHREDRERGAGLAEYGLLVALIAAVCVIAISVLGGEASTMYSSSGDLITN